MSLLLLLLLLLCWGCASPIERVVVLSTEGEGTGVTVRTTQETRALTEPYSTAAISRQGTIAPGTITAVQVQEVFGALLATTPATPRQYTLRFATGKVRLDATAQATVQAILADTAAQPAVEVEVTGYTDTVGTTESNDQLALARAAMVKELLLRAGLQAGLVRVIGRGERELAVQTADEVNEPKNRRVVVIVR